MQSIREVKDTRKLCNRGWRSWLKIDNDNIKINELIYGYSFSISGNGYKFKKLVEIKVNFDFGVIENCQLKIPVDTEPTIESIKKEIIKSIVKTLEP